MVGVTLPLMPSKSEWVDALQLAGAAIESAVGAALVLDASLSVVLANEAARAVLGSSVPRGSAAAEVLCGKSPKRPVMRALQEGRAIEAVVPHPGPRGEGRTLKVRSIPLAAERARPQGFLVMLSNPKVLLFFGAFIPQFVDPHSDPTWQVALLGVTAMAIATVSDGGYAILTGRAGTLLARRHVRRLSRASGLCLIGGGVWLALMRAR